MNFIKRKFKAAKNILKRNYNWRHDAYFCRKALTEKQISSPTGKNILILAPHSDDEWIGCSQLLKAKPEHIAVINFNMPGGDSADLHKIRYQEMSNAAETFGYTLLTVADNKEKWLFDYIKDRHIDMVFIPCYYDWHDEHFNVINCFFKVAENAKYTGLVGMYQVSVPIPAQMINCGYAMNKQELHYKWKKLKDFYPSQKFLPIKRFILNEHINGKLKNEYALESYCVNTYDTWRKNYLNVQLNEVDMKFFKDNLQNISLVREYLQNKCEEVK